MKTIIGDYVFAVAFAIIGITGLCCAIFCGATQHYLTAGISLAMILAIRQIIKDDKNQ